MTPDGARVYAAAFHSGNQTTALHEMIVPDGGEAAGGVAEPRTNFQGIPQPEVGVILKFKNGHWVDTLGRSFDPFVKLSLPDKDVFVIDTMANPPAQQQGPGGYFTGGRTGRGREPQPAPEPAAGVPCAAPPRYVQTKTSTFIMCPLLPNKYPPQPVSFCALFRPRGPDVEEK